MKEAASLKKCVYFTNAFPSDVTNKMTRNECKKFVLMSQGGTGATGYLHMT